MTSLSLDRLKRPQRIPAKWPPTDTFLLVWPFFASTSLFRTRATRWAHRSRRPGPADIIWGKVYLQEIGRQALTAWSRLLAFVKYVTEAHASVQQRCVLCIRMRLWTWKVSGESPGYFTNWRMDNTCLAALSVPNMVRLASPYEDAKALAGLPPDCDWAIVFDFVFLRSVLAPLALCRVPFCDRGPSFLNISVCLFLFFRSVFHSLAFLYFPHSLYSIVFPFLNMFCVGQPRSWTLAWNQTTGRKLYMATRPRAPATTREP